MTIFDGGVLLIVTLSILLAAWRGFVRETLALASWVIAAYVAFRVTGAVEPAFAGLIESPLARSVVVAAALFILTLIVCGLAALLIAKLLHLAGFGVADRLLGALFGFARGALIVVVLVIVGGLTGAPAEAWWREAALAQPLATAALALRPWLPAEIARRIRYSSPVPAAPAVAAQQPARAR